MKIRSYGNIPVLVSLFVLLGLFFAHATSAAEYRTILLASEASLAEIAKQKLGPALNIFPTGIDADYKSRVFITDENTKIPFTELFNRKSLKSSSVLKTISDEYQADMLAILWVEKHKTEDHKAYGLKKHIIRLRIRILDVVSGRNIVDKPISYESPFEQKTKRSALLAKALEKLGIDSLKADLDSYYAETAGTGRVKIVIRNIDQNDYFEKRDDFLALAKDAGIQGSLRDSYDRANQSFTIRAMLGADADIEEYYRSLYSKATYLQTFDSFGIDKSGQTIVIAKLPPERKRLIISGLTSDRYHDRLEIYRDALAAQDGVKDIDFKYIAGSDFTESRLAFSFTYSADITKLEEDIWNSLSAVGKAPNRRLVSISDRIIHIKSKLKEGDRITITVHFNNVAPGDYRKIGAALDKIIKGLSVRNLTKAYNRDEYRLTYGFDVNMPPVDVDTILWSKIEADEILGNIVQDCTFGNTLAYFYHHKRPETTYIRISVKNLSPQDYKKTGRRIIAIIESIEGVSNLKKSYSEYNQTLDLNFRFKGENAYAIDEAIWKAVKKDRSLKKLAMGTVSENELVYFFSGEPERAADIVIFMKQVSGQDYKVVSTAFSRLLGRIKNVRDVRYSYYFDKKTIGFSIKYEGKSLFDFEDALQRNMSASKHFKYVEKGPSYASRFLYFYQKEPVFAETTVDENIAYGETVSGLSGLIKTLDPSVVTIVAKSAESGISHGSGFFVSQEGYILTAAHVVVGRSLVVKTYDGRFYEAQHIKTDRELDLALIKAISSTEKFTEVDIGDSSAVEKGDRILVIGTPITREYEHTSVTGIISGIDRHRGLLQLSIPTYQGHSGSPVFDVQGRAIGVIIMVPMVMKAQLVAKEGKPVLQETIQAAENIGLAVPINYAKGLFQMIK